jgi:hypothetical protein
VQALCKAEFTMSVLEWNTAMSLEEWMSADHGVDLCFTDPLDPRGRMPQLEEQKKAALIEGGEAVSVNIGNVQQYVDMVCRRWLSSGVRPQILAFRKGVSDFFHFDSLLYFSPSEMVSQAFFVALLFFGFCFGSI